MMPRAPCRIGENLQREDLSDEEEANAYRTLHDQGYGSSESHNTTVLASLSDNPRLNIDKAVKNVIDKLYGRPGHYPEVAMSREVSAALDEALRAVQEWRSRNGVVR